MSSSLPEPKNVRATRRQGPGVAVGRGTGAAATAGTLSSSGGTGVASWAASAAADAILLETDSLSREEVVDRLVALIEARRRATAGS